MVRSAAPPVGSNLSVGDQWETGEQSEDGPTHPVPPAGGEGVLGCEDTSRGSSPSLSGALLAESECKITESSEAGGSTAVCIKWINRLPSSHFF